MIIYFCIIYVLFTGKAPRKRLVKRMIFFQTGWGDCPHWGEWFSEKCQTWGDGVRGVWQMSILLSSLSDPMGTDLTLAFFVSFSFFSFSFFSFFFFSFRL